LQHHYDDRRRKQQAERKGSSTLHALNPRSTTRAFWSRETATSCGRTC
jgi:hypothetical protein